MKENINFKASITAPDPNEVNYWIDLQEDPNSAVIKYYNGNSWESIFKNEPSQEILDKLDDAYTTARNADILAGLVSADLSATNSLLEENRNIVYDLIDRVSALESASK